MTARAAGHARVAHTRKIDLAPSVRLLAAAAVALPLTLAAQAAAAQEASADVQEVVVTGSRVSRAGFTTPTPTTVVNEALMNANATAGIAGVLQNLPTFKADYSVAATGPRSFGNPGAAFANLRSLGSVRTLTLLDGRRIVPSGPAGQADMNTIPALLIDRVEIVTGGASAAYGSDAVAGVVNVIFKKNLEGFTGDISYGQSSHNDYKGKHAGLAWGQSFLDGRLHLTVGGEYEKNDGVGGYQNRDWGRRESGTMPNPLVSASNPASPSNPANIIVEDYRISNTAPGGLVQSGPLKGLVFLPNGGTRQFQYGSLVGPSFMVGGEGEGLVYIISDIVDPITRRNLAGRIDFDVTDSIHTYAEAAWAKSHVVGKGAQPRDTTPLTIKKTNPFLPASVVALMTANNLTTLAVGRNNLDVGFSENETTATVTRYVVGLEGKLPGDWKWDGYAQWGRTDYRSDLHNLRKTANWNRAIDAALSPSGQIVCASTLTDPTNGCVPANIFGDGSISAASKAYFMGDEWYRLKLKQQVFAFNLRGSPFSLPAGEVSIATGIEHRKDEANAVTDPLAAIGGWNIGNQRPINGQVKVTEGYLEAVTPILNDMAFAKHLEVDTAVRVTDYSTSGRVETWKVGVNWEVSDQVRFRATRSRDIRAANISELFAQGISAQQPIVDPRNNAQNQTANVQLGNPDLKPERADTTTFGFVVRPAFIPGLDISMDHFKIDLNGAIASIAGQQIVNLCFSGTTELCQYVKQTNGVITEVARPFINIASIKTSGWDIEARYRTPLERIFGSAPGDLTLQLYATFVEHMTVDEGVGGASVDRAGETGNSGLSTYGQPDWRINFLTTYSNGPFSITGTMRYIGAGYIDVTNTPVSISNNRVKAMTYFDLSSQYQLVERDDGTRVQLYGVVQNLFDKDPPILPSQASPTNATIYDVIGRTFKVGVKFSF